MSKTTLRGVLLLPILLLLVAAIVIADLAKGEDLLIRRKYAEAAAAIAGVIDDLPVEQRARGRFLLGHSRLLAGDHEGAIAAFRRVQADHPGAAEAAGSHYLEAKALERSGDLRAAAAIYRDEVERLVGLSRKEEVAATYLGLAEKAIAKDAPQHDRAVAFFDLALDLGLPAARARAVRLRAAESLLAVGNHGQAVQRLRALLPDLDVANGKPRAMLALGRALRLGGDHAGSRTVLRDLRKLVPTASQAADAAYEIALSYGVPEPQPGMLDRAIAALRELQQRHADHDKAKTADYLIARCQAHCGRSADALVSLRSFLAAHGDSDLVEVAAARAMVGDVLGSQRKLAEAIAAWSDYLRLHPAHRGWERVQRAIVDAEFGMAESAQQEGEAGYDRARQLFTQFADRYPLDTRNPDIQARLGDMLRAEKQWDLARAAYARCVAKYPGKEPSSRAQYEIGRIHEQEKFDFEAALAAYRAVSGAWQARAQAAVRRLTEKRLELRTKRVFRSDEQAVFEVLSRNIEKVRVRVYRLALEDYFRATHTTGGIQRLDIEIIAPDKTFDSAIEKYVRHKQTRRDVAIGFGEPGAYVVKVDDKESEATTMVLVSDLALISKSNRHELLVFTQDTKEQRPRGGVKVVLSDGSKVIAEGVTQNDGVYRFRGEELQQRDQMVVFAVDASGSGASSLPLSGLGYSPGLVPKGYLYTDRPLYQPGQRVHLKGIVREVKDGLYRVPEGAGYRVYVTRPNGRPALEQEVEFSAFGTFGADLVLPADADLGSWSLCVRHQRRPECTFHGQFQVGRYERPRLALEIEPVETVVFRGEAIQGRAIARHFYGEPAVGKTVTLTLQLPDGSQLRHEGMTNAVGEVAFRFATNEFAEEALAVVHGEITGENVRQAVAVPVVTTELTAAVSTVRRIYLTDESFAAQVEVRDRSGRALAREATLVLSRLETDKRGGSVEVEVGRARVTTGADGAGSGTFRVGKGGEHRLRVEVVDRFGSVVSGEYRIGISGDDDRQKVRLLGDRDTYRAGETAAVKVMNRAGNKLALLTWQGDGILQYETRMLPVGESSLDLSIATQHAPNFALALAMIDGDQLHQAVRDFRVERDLRLSLELPKSAEPGAEVDVVVTARDADGRPVAAELSLALVDEALLAIAASGRPAIVPFFHGTLRETAFATASSCTWSYHGRSQPMNDELLAEERRAVRAEHAAREAHDAPADGAGDDLDRVAQSNAEPMSDPSILAVRAGRGNQLDQQSQQVRQVGLEQHEQLVRFSKNPVTQPGAIRRLASFRATAGLEGVHFGQDPITTVAGELDLNGFGAGQPWAGPRTDFRATGAWVQSLVTDAAGKATTRLTLPHSTTSWQLLGLGVTAATEVGEATASIATRKDLQVDFVGPPLLVEGDEAEVRLTAHNLTDKPLDVAIDWQLKGAATDHGAATRALAAHEQMEMMLRVAAANPGALEVELSAAAGALRDAVETGIPVLPFGVELQDGHSGRTKDRASFELGLPAGRDYADLALVVELGPDPGRDLIAAALGRGYQPPNCRIVSTTNLAQASRGLALLRALAHVERTGGGGQVDLSQLRAAAQSMVSMVVGRQRDAGGFAWIGQSSDDLRSTCAALRFLAMARARGLSGTEQALDKGVEWLLQSLRTAAAEDRADVVWALAACGKVRFESLNSLHRVRAGLSPDGLARLALAFFDFGRPEAAGEVLVTLRTAMPASSFAASRLQTVALATTALLRSDRRDPLGTLGLEFVIGKRIGAGWSTPEATAAAIAAISFAESTGAGAPRATAVTVQCNGVTLLPVEAGAAALTQRFVVAADKVAARGNKIAIAVEGGGEVFYRAFLTGFGNGFLKTDSNANLVRIARKYLAAPRRHEGREVPSGFGCIEGRNYKHFENQITQLRVGESCRVQTTYSLRHESDQRTRTPLVIEEAIPAGCSVPRGSIQGGFDHFELQPGRIVFFFREGNSSGWMQYELQARFPGSYRVTPTRVQSALHPEFRAHGEPGRFVVNQRDSDAADEYQLTPDERLWLGTAHFDRAESEAGEARKLAQQQAWDHLTALLDGWHKQEHHLRDDKFKQVARMMMFLGIDRGDARVVVRFFEELKDRYADLVIPFDKIVAVGKSYLDIGEFEAALLVFRATAEASFLKDAAVAHVLQQHGEFRAANAFLARLLETYPDLATMRVSRYSIGQRLAAKAAEIQPSAPIDDRVGTAVELRSQALATLREYLVLHPDDPMADEVSFAWATTFVEGRDLKSALAVTEAARATYADSAFTDEFLYASGYALFALGRHDEAFTVLRRVAEEQFPQLGGGSGDSESKWHAVYLQGQIHHARGESVAALDAYDRVIDRFGDAAEAADYFRQQRLALPEVTTIGLSDDTELKISYRNLERASVQVFKVDLMRLYLMERSLHDIRGVQLHGIRPQLSFEVELGTGRDYRRQDKIVKLALEEPGAYLVVLRGGDQLASGMVLRSDLRIEVQEQFDTGRVRVNCKLGEDFLADAHVKVGSAGSPKIAAGDTDLRGLFASDDLVGNATVIVQKDDQYAFFRGATPHQPARLAPAPQAGQGAGQQQEQQRKNLGTRFQALEQNLKQNFGNRARQIDWLEKNVLNKQQKGVEVYRTK